MCRGDEALTSNCDVYTSPNHRLTFGADINMQQRAFDKSVCFVVPLPFGKSNAASASPKRRQLMQCNINKTSDPSREDEIAARIASLRKQRRLKSQRITSNSSENTDSEPGAAANSYDTKSGLSFDDLPDWKKEEVLEGQIADAERFFNVSSNPSQSKIQSTKTSEDYKPKVSTWGVFPRPDNISQTFGGGRRIRQGGVELDSNESRKRDEAVKKKLAAYRASRGIDMEKEEAHREQIDAARLAAEKLMKKTLPYEAVEALEEVTDFTSDRSRLGGNVLLSLALAYEAVGRRQDARDVYMRLRGNPFPEISGKAKQLLQGFAAMEELDVDDETQVKGYRVARFILPDVSYAGDKIYETAVVQKNGKRTAPDKVSVGMSLGLFVIMASPALLILALVLWRR